MVRLLAFFLGLALLLSVCSSRPLAQSTASGQLEFASHTVYVVSHGWHTGLVLPAKQLHDELPALNDRFQNTPYIELGWGDQGFYQAHEITTGLTLRAIAWPTDSVVHAVAVPAQVAHHFPASEIFELCLTQTEMDSMAQFIAQSFARDKNDQIRPLNKGIYGNSQFYMGKGSYYLMSTCNTWTAKGLKSAGMTISPLFTLSADSVMNELQARQQANQRQQRPLCRIR